MANNVVGPWEVDSTLTRWFGFGATVLQNAGDLAQLGPEPFAAAAGQHSFVNGFVSARTAEGQKILLNAVLRFADAGSAAARRHGLRRHRGQDGRRRAARADPGPSRRAGGELHPDRGLHRQAVGRGAGLHRPRPLRVHATRAGRRRADPALGLVAKTIDLQGPVIDKFRATDLSEFGDISLDPTGLLATDAAGSGQRGDDHPEHHLRTTWRAAVPERSGAVGDVVLRDRDGSGGDGENERLPDQGLRERGANRRRRSTPSCSRRRSRPSRSTTCRTAAAFNWRTRASTVWARRTATRSKRPRTTCWMPSSRWPPSTRCCSSG